jgi:hypothetical protein
MNVIIFPSHSNNTDTLYVGDELYRERREFRVQQKLAQEEEECTFVPYLPGRDSLLRNQLRSNSTSAVSAPL